MKTLTITYPDDLELTLDSSAEHFTEEARVLLAYKLFELGRLTSGQAARLAGISRVVFLLCRRHPFGTVESIRCSVGSMG